MKIGVVGAGNMGSGIAQKYATEGHSVILCDNAESGLKRGQSLIENTLQEGVSRKLFGIGQLESIQSRLRFSQEFESLREVDLVIEAIFENLEAKQKLFETLDAICQPKTIFATNTSSFRVADLAQATNRADRVIGLHYFYHPAKNRLVEVIRAKSTSDATFASVFALQESINKIAITSADSPGFVVNRFFVPWLNEAMRVVEEGVTNIATVEWVTKSVFGIGMGPFELMNVTGVPITLHACTTLYKEIGNFYKPSALIGPVVERKEQWHLDGAIHEQAFKQVSDRLKNAVFQVARQMVLVENVCSIDECDLGARIGLRWKQGPFEMMAANEPSLRPKKVTCVCANRIATITLNRPDALNAIDEQLIRDLEEAFDKCVLDKTVDGIIIQGKGKCFAAGADTHFFVENMREKRIQRIVDFATYGQRVLKKIDDCPKPVVALIHGTTLGGGLELALACDHIVCIEGSQLGFPETGIGIYPGLGGTQRTPRRVSVPLARWLILSGEILDASRAYKIGLVDHVASKDEAMRTARQCIESNETKRPDGDPALQDLVALFKQPIFVIRDTPIDHVAVDAQKAYKRLAYKAPVALQIADELISCSETLSLEEGLRRELEYLAQIFSTQDALVGVSSIGGAAKPVFSGT